MNNNNITVDTDICKSFDAFADLELDNTTFDNQQSGNQSTPLCFGEFAPEQATFPAL